MSAKTLQHGLPDTPRRMAFADKTTRQAAIDCAAVAVLTWLVAVALLVTFWILFHG